MKGNQRLNLFRNLNKTQSVALNNLPKINLGFQAKVCIVTAIIFIVIGVNHHSRFSREANESLEKKEKADREADELIKKAQDFAEQTKKIRTQNFQAEKKEKLEKSLQEKQARVPVIPTSQTDGSWTAILWKLTTSAEDIVVESIDLGRTQVIGKGEDRSVTVDGAATSLQSLSDWLERLNVHLPNMVFTMEHQTTTDEKMFPVSFKILGKTT